MAEALAAAGVWVAGALGFDVAPQALILRLQDPATGWAVKARIFLSVVVAAPVVEELIFRLALFGCLLRKVCRLRFASAAAASAAIFAAVHLYPPGIPALFFLGWAFAWQYEKTGAIARPMATHALFNLANFLLALLTANC